MSTSDSTYPLVSVIITCYNQASFLPEAIDSVQRQGYPNYEIIVVDDGSQDNTREIARGLPKVNYIYQRNAGLSAARNTGIAGSRGKYLVFLDADDWFYPDALAINAAHLKADPTLAFVSGWHDKVDEWNYPLEAEEPVVVQDGHYAQLLRGNYIGMHATVMYARWILDKFKFDTSLQACEDYDLYFRITRDHPVKCHSHKLAAYRIHGNSMSSRIPFMLEHVLKVCDRQRSRLRGQDEHDAFEEGRKIWKNYYADKLLKNLMVNAGPAGRWASSEERSVLLHNKPVGFLRYMQKHIRESVKEGLKEKLPDMFLKGLHQAGFYRNYTPKPGHVKAGDFARTTPFSYDFGFDRGGAIDRHFIESFLRENAGSIKGNVLEIGDNEYTCRYGGDNVTKSDVLHVDERNPKATYTGDITDMPDLPSNRFDCIIFTQTLHLIFDFKSALATCHRILKPGGCLLLTVPGISHIDHGEWKDYWLWSFTDKSVNKLLRGFFPAESVGVKTYGNVYVAAAFLYGMGLPEFEPESLNHHDPSYQVIISAKATKPLA